MSSVNISVVIPLLNEEESLPELLTWIKKVMDANSYTWEAILVDDGSTDNSWAVIQKLKTDIENIKAFRFRRNYGKSAALNVAFQKAIGDVVITMDADLQDSPDEIPGLYKMITVDNHDLVSGYKQKRYDPITKTLPTKLFNAVTRWVSGIHNLHDFNCGLKAYKKEVVKSIEVFGEMHRYIPVMAKSAGFSNIEEKVVEHRARKYGETKFGISRFYRGFLDLITITVMTRYLKRPMHFFGAWGLLISLFGGGVLFFLLMKKLSSTLGIIAETGIGSHIPALFFGTVSFLLGVLLMSTGLLAELISRNSPYKNDYLISDTVD